MQLFKSVTVSIMECLTIAILEPHAVPPDNVCSELPPVLNGGIVYSALNLAPGTVGKYICNEGYYRQALYGRSEFNCTEYGVWDGNVATTPVTCVCESCMN